MAADQVVVHDEAAPTADFSQWLGAYLRPDGVVEDFRDVSCRMATRGASPKQSQAARGRAHKRDLRISSLLLTANMSGGDRRPAQATAKRRKRPVVPRSAAKLATPKWRAEVAQSVFFCRGARLDHTVRVVVIVLPRIFSCHTASAIRSTHTTAKVVRSAPR